MLLEHLLHPTRPETGEPSVHDVRIASALPEPRVGPSCDRSVESTRGDEAVRAGEPLAEASKIRGIGGRPSCQASEAGIRGWQGSSQRTLSSWIRKSTLGLNLHSLDTRFVLFCSNHPQGLTAQLWKVAKQWKTHREAGKVHMSLRVTVAMFILGQIKQQAEALRLKAQSEELVDSEALWLKAWSYLSWDTQSKQNVRNEEATPVDHGTMLLQLNRLLTLIPQDNVLHRFHSSGDRVHHGYWSEDGSRPGSLHHPALLQPTLCHTDCVDEHAPGQASAVHPGQSYSASDRQAVCQMRLENHSNTCYMNAFLTAWMSYSWPLKHPALFMCRLARVCWLCLRPVAPSMSYESYVTRCGLKALVTGRTLTHYMTLLSLPPSRHRSCPLTACACCGSLVLPPSRAMQSFWALTSPP